MKRKRPFYVILVILLLCALAIILYYVLRPKPNPNELVLYGNVDVRQVDIGFRVPGQVDQLFFEEGDVVEPGTLMAVLDKTPYDSQVRQAIANVESVQATLINAEKLLIRRLELIGVGAVSQEDVDNAQSTRDQLLANLIGAEEALNVAKDNLTYTEVIAPTKGIILTRIREPGTVVEASNPVYTLSVSSPVWIRAFVSEPGLGKVYFGMDAKIETDTEGAPTYTGKVGFISPVSEFTPKTVETTQLRTDLVYRLRVYVDNPDGRLKQGMPVTVKLDVKNDKEKK